MEGLHGLLYMIKDHLKDGWKHYDYAKQAHCDGDMELYRYHVEEGMLRIERMKVADKLFRKMVSEKMPNIKDDLWKSMYNDIIEDAEYLEQCFIKMKSKV